MAKNRQAGDFMVGDLLELTPQRVAHGGALVARVEGRVIFVRHAVLGEKARARISYCGPQNRYYQADLVEVLEPSEQRREHPWPEADALLAAAQATEPLGGMEYGHLKPSEQRRYKLAILREQLSRLGGLDPESPALKNLRVEQVAQADTGVRTRVHFGVDGSGRIGMYAYRSSRPRAVASFPAALDSINNLNLAAIDFTGVDRVDVAASSSGQLLVQCSLAAGAEQLAPRIAERCRQAWGQQLGRSISLQLRTPPGTGRSKQAKARTALLIGSDILRESLSLDGQSFTWEVSAGAFWQNHRAAPAVLAHAVYELAQFKQGQCIYDLYSGAGLFAALAAHGVGATGRVLSIEGSAVSSADAARNLAEGGPARSDRSAGAQVEVSCQEVGKALAGLLAQVRSGASPRPHSIIMDPPREGAGKAVLEKVTALKPDQLIYLSCDPASLGRDCAYLRRQGWQVAGLTAYDLYPNTHHLETLALFRPYPA